MNVVDTIQRKIKYFQAFEEAAQKLIESLEENTVGKNMQIQPWGSGEGFRASLRREHGWMDVTVQFRMVTSNQNDHERPAFVISDKFNAHFVGDGENKKFEQSQHVIDLDDIDKATQRILHPAADHKTLERIPG